MLASATLYMARSAGEAGQSIFAGNIVFTLTWQPPGGDSVNHPPPESITVFFKHRMTVATSAEADAAGQYGYAIVSGSCGTASTGANMSISGPNGQTGGSNTSDPPITGGQTVSVTNGVATISVPVTWNLIAGGDGGANGSYFVRGGGSASTDMTSSIVVAGHSLSRWPGSPLQQMGGGQSARGTDPTFTRWLPLAFSPTINSQPFRMAAGPLPAPWGNVDCMYSIRLTREPPSPNPDVFGRGLLILPSPGADGTYNSPSAPGTVMGNSSGTTPQVVITDATGERTEITGTDLHSNLFQTAPGLYELRSAGPPGAIKELGRYTYVFESLGPAPARARLLYIRDDAGNQQTLSWNNGLTVTDNSSGRSLVFNGAGSYFTSVDAPAVGGGPAVRTTLQYDVNGHLLETKVLLNGTGSPVQTDTFTYGGPNGDSVLSAAQNGRQASYAWDSDIWATGLFGLPIPRMQAASYGSGSDFTSSDDGGSVQGTWQYSYGPLRMAYNRWDIESRTNEVLTPRGSLYRVTVGFGNNILSNINNGEIKWVRLIGPDFSGASLNSNLWKVNYLGSIVNPYRIDVHDPFGRIWWAGLNQGRVTSLNNPLGHQWTFNWADSKLIQTQDPTGIIWGLNYGENGATPTRLTSIVDPGSVRRMEVNYNAFGQPTLINTPAPASATGQNEQILFGYNATTGDLTTITNPLGFKATVNAYDALGDPLSFSLYPDTGDPATSLNPLTAAVDWNATQNLLWARLPNLSEVVNTWSNGQLTRQQLKAPAGVGGAVLRQVELSIDSRGRVYQASDLMGSRLQFRFDKESNPTRFIDGRGYQTSQSFGPNGELTAVTWPGGQSAQLLYQEAGLPSRITDERGVQRDFSYDNAFRNTGIAFPSYPSHNVTITLDEAGRPLLITDSTGSTTINYDGIRKRITSIVTLVGGRVYTISYTYYPDGKVQTMTTPAGVTSFVYDAAGRMISMTPPSGVPTLWVYDKADRLISETTGPSQTLYIWGVSGQPGDPSAAPAYLRQIEHRVNGQPRMIYTLKRNYLGQIIDQAGSGPNGDSDNAVFTFDGRGRLNSESRSWSVSGVPGSYLGNYSWDLADNLMGGAGGWTYDVNNRLTNAAPMGGLAGATGLTYDASGNMLTGNGLTMSYDPFGRMSQVTGTPQGAVSFTYDWAGRRVSKTVGGQTTYFLYSGSDLVCEVDSAGTVQRSYNWGAHGLVSDHSPSGSRYYQFNPQGDTSTMVMEGGAVLPMATYSSWRTLVDQGLITPYKFSGRYGGYTDSETGLIQGSGSYYAPSVGRFAQPNSIGFSSGGNPYASYGSPSYVEDDPDGCVGLPRNWNGRNVSYDTFRQGVNQMANIAEGVLNTAAELNPLAVAVMAATGEDASGKCLTKGQRITGGLTLAMGPVIKGIGTGGRALLNLLPRYARSAPKHHIFPQVEKMYEWFIARGINPHDYTVPMTTDYLRWLHGNWIHGKAGGLWHSEWRRFIDNELELGRNYSSAEIWAQATSMMERYLIPPNFIPYR